MEEVEVSREDEAKERRKEKMHETKEVKYYEEEKRVG